MADKVYEVEGYAETSLIFGDFDLNPEEGFKARLTETQLEQLAPYIEIETIRELNTAGEKPAKGSKKK